MKSSGVDAYEDQQDAHAREVHRLKCRVLELEAALRDACDQFVDAARHKSSLSRARHDDEIARLRAVLTRSAARGERGLATHDARRRGDL